MQISILLITQTRNEYVNQSIPTINSNTKNKENTINIPLVIDK